MRKLRKEIIRQLISSGVIMSVILLLFIPRFQGDIDMVMQSAVYGISGYRMSRLIFSNIFIGKVLETLLAFAPNIPWYLVFHFFLTYIATVIIGYVTVTRNSEWLGKICACVVNIFIGFECYVLPNYSKTAVLLCATSIYLLFYLVESKKDRGVGYLFAIVLAGVSSMICFSAFCVAAVICIIGILCFAFFNKLSYSHAKKGLIVLLVVFVSSISIRYVDFKVYDGNEEWQYAASYKNAVEKIYTYGYPAYQSSFEHTFEMSEAQYNALVKGFFVVEDDYYYRVLEDVAELQREQSADAVISFVQGIWGNMFKMIMFYLFVFFTIIYILARKREQYLYLLTVFLGMLYVFFVFFMNYIGGYQWTEFMVFCPISMLLLLGISNVQITMRKQIWCYLGVLGLTLYICLAGTLNFEKSPKNPEKIFEEVENEGAYVMDLLGYLRYNMVFQPFPMEYIPKGNIYIANGVFSLYYGYGRYTSMPYPSEGYGLPWLYNSRGIMLTDMYKTR